MQKHQKGPLGNGRVILSGQSQKDRNSPNIIQTHGPRGMPRENFQGQSEVQQDKEPNVTNSQSFNWQRQETRSRSGYRSII